MLSEHAQGLHLYDRWTVPPHTASGIEATQESCGRKKRKKFSISMLQKLLAPITNKAQDYFGCVRRNVFMWSIHTPFTIRNAKFADECVRSTISLWNSILLPSAHIIFTFTFTAVPPYCSTNMHCSPSNATTMFVVVFWHCTDTFQTIWFIIRDFSWFLLRILTAFFYGIQ